MSVYYRIISILYTILSILRNEGVILRGTGAGAIPSVTVTVSHWSMFVRKLRHLYHWLKYENREEYLLGWAYNFCFICT